jgi:predicted Zn-dependent protease
MGKKWATRYLILACADMMDDPQLLHNRHSLAKEAIHEVGHVLGLNHCSDNCVMNLSKSEEEVRRKPSSLCPSCSTRL